MVPRSKGKKSLPPLFVPSIVGEHALVPQTVGHLYVLPESLEVARVTDGESAGDEQGVERSDE